MFSGSKINSRKQSSNQIAESKCKKSDNLTKNQIHKNFVFKNDPHRHHHHRRIKMSNDNNHKILNEMPTDNSILNAQHSKQHFKNRNW